jgi:hypothetical protein
MRELELYLKARENDISYVKNWIGTHPLQSDIDKEWAGVQICSGHGNKDHVLGSKNDWLGIGLNATAGVTTGALALLFPPLVAISALGWFVVNAIQDGNAKENNWLQDHKNWTLLQFSAENGAIDVAKFLIGKNASRHGKNGKDYIDIAAKNGHAKFVNEMRKIELETVKTKINSQTGKIDQSQTPKDSKEMALLKKEILELNEVIQKFEIYKERSEEDILKLVEKHNYLLNKYNEKLDEDQENAPKGPGMGL